MSGWLPILLPAPLAWLAWIELHDGLVLVDDYGRRFQPTCTAVTFWQVCRHYEPSPLLTEIGGGRKRNEKCKLVQGCSQHIFSARWHFMNICILLFSVMIFQLWDDFDPPKKKKKQKKIWTIDCKSMLSAGTTVSARLSWAAVKSTHPTPLTFSIWRNCILFNIAIFFSTLTNVLHLACFILQLSRGDGEPPGYS